MATSVPKGAKDAQSTGDQTLDHPTSQDQRTAASIDAVADAAVAWTLDSFPRPSDTLPPSTIPAAISPAQKRILTPTAPHRRIQSQGHLVFPTLSMTPAVPFPQASNTNTLTNTFSPMTRSSSMPIAQGQQTRAATPQTVVSTERERETYTLSDRTSTLIQTSGHIPPRLIGSTSVIHNNRMYLFGGKAVGKDPTNDLYVLDLDTFAWVHIDQRQHQRRSSEDIFRMQEEDDDQSTSTPTAAASLQSGYRQHPLSMCVQRSSDNPIIGLDTAGTAVSIPQARYYHSAVLVTAPPLLDSNGALMGWGDENAAHMVVFGGRGVGDIEGSETCLNDTHILDLNTLCWISTSLNVSNDQVTGQTSLSDSQPQHRPSIATVGTPDSRPSPTSSSNSLSSNQSSPLEQTNPYLKPPLTMHLRHGLFHHYTPQSRYAHVASLSGDHMVIFGGRDQNKECIKDISVLDLRRHVWMTGGDYNGECSQCLSTVTSAEERPMARRRRRYLECLTAEKLTEEPSLLAASSVNLTTFPTGALSQASSKVSSPLSPSASSTLLPLLNPRKNSWHRGEGHPFELVSSQSDSRQRFKSESSLTISLEQDDSIRSQEAKLQGNINLVKTHGLVGLGMDPEITKAMAQSAGVHMTTEEAFARARQPSTGTMKIAPLAQATTPSNASTFSSGSEKSKTRSRSPLASPLQSPPLSRTRTNRSTSQSSTPVTHAIPTKFFTKSNGSLFDLDDLATTIARDNRGAKSQPSKIKDRSSNRSQSNRDRDSQFERSSSSRVSMESSRWSSGTMDDTRSIGSQKDAESLYRSEKRRSLDSAMDTAHLSLPGADRSEQRYSKSPRAPAAVSQPLYMFSGHPEGHHKPRFVFLKVQESKDSSDFTADKASFDVKHEWTALDVGSGMTGSAENLLPPRMLSPVGHIVDHYFLLSGVSIADHPTSATPVEAGQTPHDSTGAASKLSYCKRNSYSVWMHHLHNHHWTQLELSKNLSIGDWSQSVLDRQGNFLYILGQRNSSNRQGVEEVLAPEDFVEQDAPEQAAAFTHMIKVDLEGFEICPTVDEASIGSAGVKLGLQMLKDGIGADVVLVSSVDDGRVRVNSGIVGQRWGYFQTLMEERQRIRTMEFEERLSKKNTAQDEGGASVSEEHLNGAEFSRYSMDSNPTMSAKSLTSKRWYLGDHPAEIVVPETTPVLVGFLQYIYTNELATTHQRKLKTLSGLLLLAHFYDLTRLQQLVRRELYQQLNASNAPAICEVAVLTHEFGLQTRALRTLLQSARLAQLRQQGEAAEAKRRLEFAMSRLEEIEEERKRKSSLMANQTLLQQAQQQGMSSPGSRGGLATSNNNAASYSHYSGHMHRAGSASSNPTSSTSTPGLSTIGRFFRHREEPVESVGPVN
ncbi:hypothetical protein BGZ51_008411 [Haplosporangium sp. Z 767]|nr:hypothetical protein BGZ51_008411 [Haplosporangium sp. Z 767]KAF9184488.1 hypothetical protein BGZ50_003630 [Haplosporangium sp. Z 11]